MTLNLPDEKLNAAHLKVLLVWKKRKTDGTICKLKKEGMLKLWKEWKTRWDEPCQ